MVSFISASVGYDSNSEGQNKTICGKDTYITLVQRRNSGQIFNEAIAIIVSDILGNRIFTLHSRFKRDEIKHVGEIMKIVCCIPKIQLLPGEYYLTLRAIVNGSKGSSGEVADHIENAISFRVYEGDYYGTGELPISKKHGQIAVDHSWSFEEIL
jgi:lipopolysaccharide transport system ATP-binding protein